MTTLTFHGGAGEIGGNKILLETAKTRIFLDFGLNFDVMGMYYDDFMKPRGCNGLGDYIDMGITPWLKGLYRNDLTKKAGFHTSKALFDGVLLTHPHIDHFGDFPLLHEDIPLYMGEGTKLFIQAIEDTGGEDYLSFRNKFTGLHYTKNPVVDRKVNTFRSGKSFEINEIKVTPVHVDHSIPGAYGYIIETKDKVIAYTGDIRMHGAKGYMTQEFIDKAASFEPDVLIVEGTRVDGSSTITEEAVKLKIKEFVGKTKELVVANFPARDIDRFNTFYEVAKTTGRKLVIDLKQAYLLQSLEQDNHLDVPKYDDKHLLVYLRRMKDGMVCEDVSIDCKEKDYDKWQRPFLSAKNAVTFKQIEQKKSIFYCNTYQFGELIDIKPKKGSSYIYSLCEPFNESMELDKKRVDNWLEHFGLSYNHAHASGHCSKEDLKKVVETINAKMIIPVHTEHAEAFKEWGKVKVVERGNVVKL